MVVHETEYLSIFKYYIEKVISRNLRNWDELLSSYSRI
jgi:hypothetical protein